MINEYDVTESLYIQWVFESKKEGKKLFFLIFWSLMFLACIGLLVVYRHEYFLLLVALYCAYRAVIRDYMAAKGFYRKSHGDGKWHRIIRIFGDDIVIDDGNITMNYKTTDIVKVVLDEKKIRLFMNDNNSIRLYKDSFVEGDWQNCELWK